MKKQLKSERMILRIGSETLRALASPQLQQVAGGVQTYLPSFCQCIK